MFKKILLILLVILAAVLCVVYYYVDKITTLPEWYTQPKTQINTDRELFRREFDKNVIDSRTKQVREKIDQAGRVTKKQTVTKPVSLNAEELHDLMLGQMMERGDGDSLMKSVKATHVKINPNSIETGAVVDLTKLSDQSLTGSGKELVQTATKVFPFLKDKEVHISVEGKPVMEKGKLNFDSDAKVNIGEMQMTLGELADKLGTTVEKLKKNTGVEFSDKKINDITIDNNQVIIK